MRARAAVVVLLDLRPSGPRPGNVERVGSAEGGAAAADEPAGGPAPSGGGPAGAPGGTSPWARPGSAAYGDGPTHPTGATGSGAGAPDRETAAPASRVRYGEPPHPPGAVLVDRPSTTAVEPPPPRTHRWGLGAFLLTVAVFLLTSVLIGLVAGAGPPSAGSLAVALAVPTLLAAGTALLITKLRGNGPLVDLRLGWSWHDVGLGAAFGVGGLFLTVPASILYMMIVGPEATSAVGEVFSDVRATPLLAVAIFAIVVFVAPLCEEIVYRGMLWGAVERLGAGRWVVLAVTTLVFALAHFELTRTPLLLVVAIPIGLARLYTGRLLAGIVAHQVNNLLPGVALLLGLVGALPTL